jgi:hypothetical protein
VVVEKSIKEVPMKVLVLCSAMLVITMIAYPLNGAGPIGDHGIPAFALMGTQGDHGAPTGDVEPAGDHG